jgi:hypothetical protein
VVRTRGSSALCMGRADPRDLGLARDRFLQEEYHSSLLPGRYSLL